MSTSYDIPTLRIDTDEVCALFVDMSFCICSFGRLCCELLHSYDQRILLDILLFVFSPGFEHLLGFQQKCIHLSGELSGELFPYLVS